MAKPIILLTGKNTLIVDDFFMQLSDDFECITTSERYDDILAHIKYINVDMVLYCMADETKDAITRICSARQKMIQKKIPLAVYGSEEEVTALAQNPASDVSLQLIKPMNTSNIKLEILKYFRNQEELEKEREAAIANERAAVESVIESVKKHILVIDDDPMMLKLIKEYLHEDYQVATAINGKTALKFLEKKSTDLILLDYEMPGDNGPAVLRQLRENVKTAAIPVIFLTGITERGKIQEALAQKPQGYLLKPIDHDKLVETIVKFV